jgi:hypothetical protein
MSLVRELQLKKAIERTKQVESMASYLRGLGIDAAVVTESAEGITEEVIAESVIQLKKQNINRIRLLATDFISCGMIGSVSRFRYEVLLDKNMPHNADRRINSKTRPLKEKKFLGLFGGKVVDIKWVGRDLADRLNHDSNIKGVLLQCTRSWGNAEFQIQMESPSVIEILGPRFAESQWIPQLDTIEGKKGFEDCVFGFNICNRIAKYIRDIVAFW